MKTTDLIWLGQRLAEMGRAEMRAAPGNASATELIVMGDLLDNTPSTITTVAQRTGYAQSRISTVVAALVARGWAQTTQDPTDGRRTLVSIPASVHSEARRFRSDSENRTLLELLDGYLPTRRTEVVQALEELLTALRAAEAHDVPRGSAAT